MRILFFGDVVGKQGIQALSDALPSLVEEFQPDFIIANGENASHGFGITHKDYLALREAGVDVVTLGNHWHNRGSIDDYIEDCPELIRPYNVRDYDLGSGSTTFDVNGIPVTVTNLLGTAFMKEEVSSPVFCMNDIIQASPDGIHIVDYHAESTSEKATFAYFFDGRVTAVLGTHTHVQTADARVLPKGTAFISDVGLNGNYESVIGFEPESVIQRILFGNNHPITTEQENSIPLVNAVFIEADDETYLATSIIPIYRVGGKERIHG